VVAGVAAVGLLTALIVLQEQTVVSGPPAPTLPPPRLLGDDHLPTVAQVRPRPVVVDAVPIDSAPPVPRPMASAAPTAPPTARPVRVSPAAAAAARPPKPPVPPPPASAVPNPNPNPNPDAALARARAALAACDCAAAREQLETLASPPPAFTRALSACRLPMLGQRCAPSELP
jgi:hypothetical protein